MLKTDHKPLIWLKTLKEPKGRQARWLATIGEYAYTLQHIPEKDNVWADALPRILHAVEVNQAGMYSAEDQLDSVKYQSRVNAVGFIPGWSPDKMAQLQKEDRILSIVRNQIEN